MASPNKIDNDETEQFDFDIDAIAWDSDEEYNEEEQNILTPLQKHAETFNGLGRVVFPVNMIVRLDDKKKICKDFPKPGWNKLSESEAIKKDDKVACCRTGKVSNITVIDFDDEEAYDSVADKIGNCYTVKTRRGYHVYFKYTPELKTSGHVGADEFKDIDIKNDGGHITMPGSTYTNPLTNRTASYYVYNDGVIKDVPYCILDMITDKGKCKSKSNSETIIPVVEATVVEDPKNTDADIATALAKIIDIQYIDNVESWKEILWAMKNCGVSESFATEWSKQSEEFADNTMLRFWDYAGRIEKYTMGTIYHYAALSNKKEARAIRYPKTDKVIVSDFDEIAEQFEAEGHAKIGDGSYLTRNTENNDIICVKRSQMVEMHEHLAYNEVVNGVSKKNVFIHSWMTGNPNIKRYRGVNVFPPGSSVPDNWANLWTPFKCERLKEYEPVEGAAEFMIEHINILCGNNNETADWLIKWIAHAIQKPNIKPMVMPILIGKEGCGKSSVGKLLASMVGTDKTADVANASAICINGFNGQLMNSYLVLFNELSKSKMDMEQMKNTITEERITINEKNVKAITIDSYHRFIAFTNNEDPMHTSIKDRRTNMIQVSNVLIENYDYFTKFHGYLKNTDALMTIYTHFKNINLDEYNPVKIPKNKFHQQLKLQNRPIITQWLTSLIEECDNAYPTMSQSNKEWFNSFNNWKNDAQIKYELSIMQFTRRLSLLDYGDAIYPSRQNNTRTHIINFNKLQHALDVEESN